MRVLLDARLGRKMTGIGYYTVNVLRELGRLFAEGDEVRPIVKPWQAPGLRVRGFEPWWSARRELDPADLPAADVIHGPNFHALRHPTATEVATIHDLGYVSLPECHPPGMGERLDAIVREALPRTATFICDSATTRDAFVDRYAVDPSRCPVVHLGVDSARFSPGETGPVVRALLRRHGIKRYLLHVGAMVPRKDLGTLMRVFELIAPRHPDLHLVLAGNKTRRWASDWPKVKAWSKDHPVLAERVTILNYTSGRLLPDLYRRAEAVVSTSLLEGFGLPVLEALACGTPVVASSGSAVEEYAKTTIRYGVPRHPDSYADSLTAVLRGDTDPAPGLTLADRMTWRRTAEGTLRAYEQATGKVARLP